MIAFIKEHRKVCGVEPICHVLQIAPSTFYAHLTVEKDPDKASDRAKRDAELLMNTLGFIFHERSTRPDEKAIRPNVRLERTQ